MKSDPTVEIPESQVEALDDLMHRLIFALSFDQLDQLSDKLAGLQGVELHLMQLVSRNPSLVLKEIREQLRMPNSTLTSMIDRLEKRGLLMRRISTRDRRSFELQLTPKGKSIQAEHDRVDRLVAAQILQSLDTDEERDMLLALLTKVTGRLG